MPPFTPALEEKVMSKNGWCFPEYQRMRGCAARFNLKTTSTRLLLPLARMESTTVGKKRVTIRLRLFRMWTRHPGKVSFRVRPLCEVL